MKHLLCTLIFLAFATLSACGDPAVTCPEPELLEPEPVLTSTLVERSSCENRCGGHGSKVPSGEQCLCFEGGGFPTCSDYEEFCGGEVCEPSCVMLGASTWDCTGTSMCDAYLARGITSVSIVLSCTP